jgi:tetratricopeptide (TPR) repeat protein
LEKLLLSGGFDTAAEQHHRLLNHRLLKRYAVKDCMNQKTTQTSTYEQCVQTALKHYADAEWLGDHSPLAQPYFLGMHSSTMPSAAQRGQALQQAIAEAWETLWGGALPADEQTLLDQFYDSIRKSGKGSQYFALALELRYLRRVVQPQKPCLVWENYLKVSKAQYHRDLSEAVRKLGENLLRGVHSGLHIERPMSPAALYGRQTNLDELFAILSLGKSVNLCGMSGMGKTSLAAAICQRWPDGSFFWYTVRPRLNDRLDGFLFVFAYFLHQHGASGLWQQILADHGEIKNLEMAESLAMHAVRQLDPPPLLVIDDADLLRPVTFEAQNQEYARFLGFLKSLRKNATVLFVGQRVTLTDTHHIELGGITLAALLEWLRALKIDHQPNDLQDLLNYTSGAPRLLTLCLALIQNGMPVNAITAQLKNNPGVGALMSRLINQIDEVERQVFAELAIFRQSAPVDAWQERQPALKSLAERGLVQVDLLGGVSLFPVWSDLALAELSPETKATLHGWAARARLARGEYTEAAYHYWQAGYPETAIQIWYPNREHAIASGQASSARIIFNAFAAHRLPQAEQRALALIRADLARLNGDFEKGLRDLGDLHWPASRASSEAHKLRGIFLRSLGDNFGALREYQAGLDDLAALTRQQVVLLTGRSARFKDEGDYSQAWKEIKHARYLIDSFQGNIFNRQGQYAQAKECYLRALELARELDNKIYLAQTHASIGTIIAQRKPEEAYPHLRLALETLEKIGDQVQAQLVRNNMAVAMIHAGRYHEALPLAQSVVDFALSIRHRANTADAAVNLSEIFFNLGNFDEAVHWAKVSIAQEQTVVIPYALNMIGLVDNARKDFAHAETCFRSIIQEETSEPYIVACAWRGLGETYKLQGQTDLAREAFHKAIALFEQQNMQNEVDKTCASF